MPTAPVVSDTPDNEAADSECDRTATSSVAHVPSKESEGAPALIDSSVGMADEDEADFETNFANPKSPGNIKGQIINMPINQ